jgi:hypothetical protein
MADKDRRPAFAFGVFTFDLKDFPDLFPSEFDAVLEYIEDEIPSHNLVVRPIREHEVLFVGRASTIRRILKTQVFNYFGGGDDYLIWLKGQSVEYCLEYPPSVEKKLRADHLFRDYGSRVEGRFIVGPQLSLRAWFYKVYCSERIESYLLDAPLRLEIFLPPSPEVASLVP